MLLFLNFLSAASILKELQPKDLITFYEEINSAEDQYATLGIGIFSQSPDLYYRIIPPTAPKKSIIGGAAEDSQVSGEIPDIEQFEKPLERSVSTKLEAPGVWTVQIYNKGDGTQRISISSHVVKKINKGNEDIAELRNLLNSIQSAVEGLANENHYAIGIQKSNINDAKRIKSTLNWLLCVPFVSFGISWFKYICARQLVRPKGKRFKGLF